MMRNNVFFDTCVYHLPGIELLTKVVPIDNILFGSEMVGAVRGIDPRTGHYYDDTKRYLDALPLSAEDKKKIFRRQYTTKVYPRINKKVEQCQGKCSQDTFPACVATQAGWSPPGFRRGWTAAVKRNVAIATSASC